MYLLRLGTELQPRACALTRNWTYSLSLCGMTPNRATLVRAVLFNINTTIPALFGYCFHSISFPVPHLPSFSFSLECKVLKSCWQHIIESFFLFLFLFCPFWQTPVFPLDCLDRSHSITDMVGFTFTICFLCFLWFLFLCASFCVKYFLVCYISYSIFFFLLNIVDGTFFVVAVGFTVCILSLCLILTLTQYH